MKTPRLVLAFLACAVALIALPELADAASRARDARCENTRLQPSAGNLGAVRAAVLCLHNRERAERDLPRLKESKKLGEAATKHSDHMVDAGFFAHDTPSGTSMTDRIVRTGYAGDDGWTLGENIAWGTGELATAAEIQRAWMESPGHRANVLRREFHEIGIGIALGAPVGARGRNGATYTADFGARR